MERSARWGARAGTLGAALLLGGLSGCSSREASRREGAAELSPPTVGAVERLRALPAIRERLDRTALGDPFVARAHPTGPHAPGSESLRWLRTLPAFAPRLQAAVSLERRPEGFVRFADGRARLRAVLPADADKAMRLSTRDPSAWIEVQGERPRVAATLVEGLVVFADPLRRGHEVVFAADSQSVEEIIVVHEAGRTMSFRWGVRRSPAIKALRVRDERVEALDALDRVRIASEPMFAVDSAGARRHMQVRVEHDEIVATLDATGLQPPIAVDPVWKAVASMKYSRENHMQHTLPSGSVVVFGGGMPVESREAELYDPTLDSWSVGPRMAHSHRNGASVELADGRVLVVGGYDGLTWLPDAEVFDGSKWSAAGRPNTGRIQFALIGLADGRVLAAGGTTTGGVGTSTAELFDLKTSTWTTISPMPGAPKGCAGVLLPSGRALVMLGGNDLSAEYDPVTDTWTSATPTGSSSLTRPVLLGDGQVMAFGTVNGASNATAVYSPATRSWTRAPDMLSPRLPARVVSSPLGGVVAIGSDTQSSAELFDLDGKRWLPLAPMSTVRRWGNASRIGLATVLVTGGSSDGTTALSSAEELSVASGPGLPCALSTDCISGFCLEGVCCDSKCDAGCMSCFAKHKASGPDGFCGPVRVGSDPYGSCKDDGSPSCALDGHCDGAARCSTYAVASGCAPSSCLREADCTTGFCADGICCDRACTGPCEACTAARKGGGIDGLCGAVPIDTDPRDRCPTDPGFPANCRADGLCDGAGACRVHAPAATLCGTPTCAAGTQKTPSCDGAGVCNLANVPCSPFACSADGSVCAKLCALDGDCDAASFCDAGSCKAKKLNGTSAAENRECQSGVVADGVCCNASCDGICEACDATKTKGTCTAIVGGARHGTCPVAGSDPCAAAACDGKTTSSCAGFPNSDTVCQVGSCAGGIEIPEGRCDGSGLCQAPAARKCEPYTCAAKTCRATCAVDTECADGFKCKAGACAADTTKCSDDGLSQIGADGTSRSCAPARCKAGRCVDRCADGTDCASGYRCSADGACVASDGGGAESSGGCATGRASTSALGAIAALALVGLAGRRRGARAQRS